MIQLDAYALDGRLMRSLPVEGEALYATLCRLAGHPIEAVTTRVLGQVAVMRVDLGRRGYAVLERIA